MVVRQPEPPRHLLLTLLYLLVGALTLGLLSPAAMAGLLGRFRLSSVGLGLLFALPFWVVAIWKISLATGLLWLVTLAVAHAWLGDFKPWAWVAGLAFSLSHLLLWTGLILGFLLLTPFKDPITPWLTGGFLLAAVFLVEGSMRIMRRYHALLA